MATQEPLVLDGTHIAYVRAALAACIPVYETRLARLAEKGELPKVPWRARTWDLTEGCPAMRMLLAAWVIAERWKECGYVPSRHVGTHIAQSILGDPDDPFLVTVGLRLKEAAKGKRVIERRVDPESRKSWFFVRRPTVYLRYLAHASAKNERIGLFARLVAEEYRLYLDARASAYVSALEAWGESRRAQQKTPET